MRSRIAIALLFATSAFAVDEVGFKGNTLETGAISRKLQKSVTITADNQEVNVQRKSVVKINSDSAVLADRTFVLRKGKDKAQVVQLRCDVNGGNQAELVDDSNVAGAGKIKLSGNWVCSDKWDNLELQWSGNHWYETGRNDL